LGVQNIVNRKQHAPVGLPAETSRWPKRKDVKASAKTSQTLDPSTTRHDMRGILGKKLPPATPCPGLGSSHPNHEHSYSCYCLADAQFLTEAMRPRGHLPGAVRAARIESPGLPINDVNRIQTFQSGTRGSDRPR
jgi:hypothetical protein